VRARGGSVFSALATAALIAAITCARRRRLAALGGLVSSVAALTDHKRA